MTAQEKEEPLDPAVEAIRVKMVRLLFVSGGIMMLGLMAVLAAIVYKITRSPVGEGGAKQIVATSATVSVPKGAKVLSAMGMENGLMVTIEASDGKTMIRRYNGEGKLVSTYSVIEE